MSTQEIRSRSAIDPKYLWNAESVFANRAAWQSELVAVSATIPQLAAFAGSLYVYYLGFIEPGFLSIDQSLAIVAMVLLGGRGAVAAPVIGAFVLTALPHIIHFGAEVRSIVYGSILILTILLMPQGIYGSIRNLIVDLRRSHAA